MYYFCITMKVLREKIIPVRVTPEELIILQNKANTLGIPLSTYLRLKGLTSE